MDNKYNNKKIISICIPILNERDNIKPIYDELKKIFNSVKEKYDFEIIFTDNLSSDGSFDIVKSLSKNDKTVKGFQFSKNIGKEKSLMYGFRKSKGDAIIQIDCDFEDPPELILKFIEKWEENYEIVYGRRKKRLNDNYSFLRYIFYRFINLISEDNLPEDAGDFRLCDRKVIDKIISIDDQDPYIRGLISSIGFKQIGIDHDRGQRIKDKSKFGIKNYFSNAINGITNHSIIPLKIASYLGFITFFVSLILTFFYFIHGIIFETKMPGFTTQTLLLLFAIAFNSIFLGVIGEYLGRIYRQIKKNDIYFIIDNTED